MVRVRWVFGSCVRLVWGRLGWGCLRWKAGAGNLGWWLVAVVVTLLHCCGLILFFLSLLLHREVCRGAGCPVAVRVVVAGAGAASRLVVEVKWGCGTARCL